jgi:hypothetical protein
MHGLRGLAPFPVVHVPYISFFIVLVLYIAFFILKKNCNDSI